MIVHDPIDRFETNFGVNPNSISLAPVWTSPFSATNIEEAGQTFDTEDDFGDGMTGINGGMGSFFGDLASKVDNLRFGGGHGAGRSGSSHGVFPVEQRSVKEWNTPTAQAQSAQRAQIVGTSHPMQGSQPVSRAVQFKPPVAVQGAPVNLPPFSSAGEHVVFDVTTAAHPTRERLITGMVRPTNIGLHGGMGGLGFALPVGFGDVVSSVSESGFDWHWIAIGGLGLLAVGQFLKGSKNVERAQKKRKSVKAAQERLKKAQAAPGFFG